LNSLSLSHNTQLSLTFESNVNYNFSLLTKLHLSSLSLTQFPNLFPNLYYLDLSNNKLRDGFPIGYLKHRYGWTSLKTVSLL
jgi:Leucine-rich repeat (LRR) protein